MKSIKFVAGLAAGVAVLGAVSAHAIEAIPLYISITTYQQTKTTNADGVITYTSTTVALKSADLAAKAATSLGVTMPAGAVLGLSIIHDEVNNVFAGDVVIMSATGSILWDVDNFGNATGRASMSVGFSDDVKQRATSAYNPRVPQRASTVSTSTSVRGRGNLHFDIQAYPTIAVAADVGCRGDFFDDVGFKQYVVGNNGRSITANLATGNVNFSGGGEYQNYGLDFNMIQPANVMVTFAGANIPSDIFFDIF